MDTFAEFLRKRIKERNLKINQLAKLSGVSSSEVSRLATGDRKSPNPRILRKLAPVLRVPLEELLKIAYPEKPVVTEKISEKLLEKDASQFAKEIAKYTAKELTEIYNYPESIRITGYKNSPNIESEVGDLLSLKFLVDSDFAVFIKGDSLKSLNIVDGDIALIKEQNEVPKDQLLLVRCDNRPVIRFSSDLKCKSLEIIGVVTHIVRKYSL